MNETPPVAKRFDASRPPGGFIAFFPVASPPPAPSAGSQASPRLLTLQVGDWCFAIWKEGMQTAIFGSPCATNYLTAGCWSPTRPGVIYIAKQDGELDVWDLLDRWGPLASCRVPLPGRRLPSPRAAFTDRARNLQVSRACHHRNDLLHSNPRAVLQRARG